MTETITTARNDEVCISLFPAKGRELVDLIGLPATLLLIKEYGGQAIWISRGKQARGTASLAVIARVIGPEAAQKLAFNYGSECLAVPACRRALWALRDISMQARFDTLTSGAGSQSARCAVNQLAKEFDLDSSTVWRALKRGPAAP